MIPHLKIEPGDEIDCYRLAADFDFDLILPQMKTGSLRMIIKLVNGKEHTIAEADVGADVFNEIEYYLREMHARKHGIHEP